MTDPSSDYVRPQLKNFLSHNDQQFLDKFMGRPEKPVPNAYSLVLIFIFMNADLMRSSNHWDLSEFVA